MEEPKNNRKMKKAKTLPLSLGQNLFIAVPDVKSYILWHYCINMKIREKGATNTLPLIKPLNNYKK